MPVRSSLPLPLWLLAAEFVATAMLATGLLMHFGASPGHGLPRGAALAPVVLGGMGMLASSVAVMRHLAAVAASRKSR